MICRHSPAVITVLAEGAGYLAVAKPAGRIVVPGRGSAANELTVRAQLEAELGRRLLVVHRLDRQTSGVLLLATDAEAHRALSRAFEHHAVVKRYWALVRGSLFGSGAVELPLAAIRGGNVRVLGANDAGGKPSHTAWRALERLGGYTAVEFRPRTGRLHQIRAHAAAMGHPLAVDPDYGGAAHLTVGDLAPAGRNDGAPSAEIVLARTTLHAWSIKFPDPASGESVVVEAPLPDDLSRVVALLRGLSP
jgi:RluA family pseudouridine synthase